MQVIEMKGMNRREFFKKAGCISLGAGAGAAGVVSSAFAQEKKEKNQDIVIKEYWTKKQAEYEALENENRQVYKAFGPPPKYVYRGTDWSDDKATFYAPLQEECKYLPEFQSIFTEGTAGQYFKFTLKFGMKDIIRFHGHSCEALYYTAAIIRLICDKLFPERVVDRTLLRGIGGQSP